MELAKKAWQMSLVATHAPYGHGYCMGESTRPHLSCAKRPDDVAQRQQAAVDAFRLQTLWKIDGARPMPSRGPKSTQGTVMTS